MSETMVSDSEQLESPGRRALSGLGSKFGMGAAIGAAALGAAGLARKADAATLVLPDSEVANFALNFEYLGSQYYLHAVVGGSLPSSLLPAGSAAVTVPSTTTVPFVDPAIAYYGIRFASDEQAHVFAFQSLVTMLGGTPIPQPAINLDNTATGAWSVLAQAAGLVGPGQTFNPYESDVNFMLGAYVLEDVCITALVGAASLLTNPTAVTYAAKAIGVEAMQAGAIRGFLSRIGAGVATDAISALRAKLSGVGDNGTSTTGNPYRFANLNTDSIAFGRTPGEVLAIAYGGNGLSGGGFFPNGVNGAFTVSAS